MSRPFHISTKECFVTILKHDSKTITKCALTLCTLSQVDATAKRAYRIPNMYKAETSRYSEAISKVPEVAQRRVKRIHCYRNFQ
jgi:hypothetical protein